MKRAVYLLLLLGAVGWRGQAAVPHEQLLPEDTLLVLSAPDWTSVRQAVTNSATYRLWNDPAVQPFRQNLRQQIEQHTAAILRTQSVASPEVLLQLPQGQLTLAVVRHEWKGLLDGSRPAVVLLADVPGNEETVQALLDQAGNDTQSTGLVSRVVQIGDHPFIPLPANGKETNRYQWFVGRVGSLVIAGDTPAVVQGILNRQSGTNQPVLAQSQEYLAAMRARRTNSLAYGWLHTEPVFALLNEFLNNGSANTNNLETNTQIPGTGAIIEATGLTEVRTITATLGVEPTGTFGELRLGIPAAERRGLVRLLEPLPLDASPPDFVGADVQVFQRIRLDLPTAWQGVEQSVRDAFPSAGNTIDLVFSTLSALGRAENPKFDMRSELVGNLGQDIVILQQPASAPGVMDLDSGPSLLLIGSPHADRVANALKLAGLLLPPPYNEMGIQHLGDKTLYLIPTDDDNAAPLGFLGAKGYLAMSTSTALIESFLGETLPESERLNRLEGLAAAVEKVGGFNTGFFVYENDRLTARATLNALKQDSALIERWLRATPWGARWSATKPGGIQDGLGLSLLPAFDQIAHHFHFTVYGIGEDSDAITYRSFSPQP